MTVIPLLLALSACFPDPAGSGGDTCTGCHGDPAVGPAPPRGLGGSTDEAYVGVGAHAAHVQGGMLNQPVACTECHQWPTTVGSAGHTDTPWPAEVMWGTLAKTGGATVAWDREGGTCTVYCHGATLTGGLATTPAWTGFSGGEGVCGGCHGDPPPPPHAQSMDCATCHGPMTPDTHLNGVVDCGVDGTTGATGRADTPTTTVEPGTCDDLPCALCHGTDQSAAPPPDVLGNTDTSARGVGAHAIHLAGTPTSMAVGCWGCHVETHAVSDPGHVDPSPAEVVFSGIATQGVTATYDADALTCTTYCHGTGSSGGTVPDPIWNVVDGSQTGCDACHGNPPGGYHPPAAPNVCDSCHQYPFDATTHVDGVLQLFY